MKKFKIATLFSIILALCFSFSACGKKSAPQTKTFKKLEMQITLTDEFIEKTHLSQTVYYESIDVIVTALREEYNLFPSSYTVEDYANAVITNNVLEDTEVFIDNKHDYAYFSYEKEVNSQELYYFATCHASDTAFWLIQFCCTKEDKPELLDTFKTYASSVKFEIETISSAPTSRVSRKSSVASIKSQSVSSSSITSSISNIATSSLAPEQIVGTYTFYGMITEGETYLISDPLMEMLGFTEDSFIIDVRANGEVVIIFDEEQATGTWYLEENQLFLISDEPDGEPLILNIEDDLLYMDIEDGDFMIFSKSDYTITSSSTPNNNQTSSGYQDF